MSHPRTVITTLAMVFLTGLIVVMLAVLWMVGQDLRHLMDSRSDVSAKFQKTEQRMGELADELKEAKGERAKVAEGLRKATEAIEALRVEATATQARLKALEEAPKAEPPPAAPAHQPGVGLPPPKGPDAPDPQLVVDDAQRARIKAAREPLMPRLHAAEKAHAKVSIEGDAVRIEIAPFPEEGRQLIAEWRKLLAGILTPEQFETYKKMRLDGVDIRPGLGEEEQVVLISRDEMGLKFDYKRRALAPGAAGYESAGTVSGANALERLRWRHLLTPEAVAKLRGAAQPQ